MKLNCNKIIDLESWFGIAPPEGGKKQWKDGRSAKELARYLTAALPQLPKEIETALFPFSPLNTTFNWDAEYKTELPGKGHPRQHDAALWNDDLFVGIEAKADETFGESFVSESYLAKNCSENKKRRIKSLCSMLWGKEDDPIRHTDIRYQLLAASTACLLEAFRRRLKKAMLLILVFKKDGYYEQENINKNNADLDAFLRACDAVPKENGYLLQTTYGKNNGINLFVQKIEIAIST